MVLTSTHKCKTYVQVPYGYVTSLVTSNSPVETVFTYFDSYTQDYLGYGKFFCRVKSNVPSNHREYRHKGMSILTDYDNDFPT